jgi:hypothetical protein
LFGEDVEVQMRQIAITAVSHVALLLLVGGVTAGPASAQQRAGNAPVPRTADGKPDLTGVYQASSRRGAWDFDVPGDEPGAVAARPPGDAQPTGARPEPVPFRPEARVRAQEILNRRSIDDPATLCLTQPSPRMTPVGLFPIQFVQTPQQLVVMYEYFGEFRVIPTDGRKQPDDIEPTYLGNPVGHWDGDTLVVDMIGFKPGLWFGNGLVTSDALKITERYTRVDRDQLNYEAILDDPKVLTKPYTMRATLMLREGTRLREYSCLENNVDPQRYDKLLTNPATFTRTPGQ